MLSFETPGAYKKTSTADSIFLTGDTVSSDMDMVHGKSTLTLIVHYGESISKIAQLPLKVDVPITETLSDEISALQEHIHLRATLMFSCSDGTTLFQIGDLVYLSRYLRATGVLRRFSLAIDFSGVNESDSISVALLILRIRQLGFQICSNSNLGKEIINNLLERFVFSDEISTAIGELETREFYESLL